LREMLNAIFYVIRTGCQWRLLPHEFPAWKTTYHSFRLWRKAEVWEQRHTTRREQLRGVWGRDVQPRAGIIDSQSVKTTAVGGERGDDGAKRIKGHKRHVLVDTQGWVLTVKVHPANVMDRDGVTLLLPPAHIKAAFPRLMHVWRAAGYNGTEKGQDGSEKHLGWTTQMVKPPPRRVIILEHVEPTPRLPPAQY
jgi:putative transposase